MEFWADFRLPMYEFYKKKTFKRITHKNYLKAIRAPIPYVNTSKDRVAVITAKGTIVDGSQKEGSIGGDTVSALIRKARNDEKVKAIVLRVDSGGGSAFASEIIREQLVKAQEQGIKVVASMGDVAASGGYWISMGADKILAQPTTLTGSIGIFSVITTFEKGLNDIINIVYLYKISTLHRFKNNNKNNDN